MSILEQLSKGEISLDDAKTDIRMTFHRGDVISDNGCLFLILAAFLALLPSFTILYAKSISFPELP